MTSKRHLAIAAAALAAVAGGGIVIATAFGHGTSPSARGGMPGGAGFTGGGPGGGFGRHGGPGLGGPGAGLAAAAAYLGLSQTALQTDLQSGKTLAELAKATSGTTVDGLVAAIVAAEKTQLDAAVAAGTLTATQEQTQLADAKTRATGLVNGTGFGGGPGPGGPSFGGPGSGGSGGPGGPTGTNGSNGSNGSNGGGFRLGGTVGA